MRFPCDEEKRRYNTSLIRLRANFLVFALYSSRWNISLFRGALCLDRYTYRDAYLSPSNNANLYVGTTNYNNTLYGYNVLMKYRFISTKCRAITYRYAVLYKIALHFIAIRTN